HQRGCMNIVPAGVCYAVDCGFVWYVFFILHRQGIEICTECHCRTRISAAKKADDTACTDIFISLDAKRFYMLGNEFRRTDFFERELGVHMESPSYINHFGIYGFQAADHFI